MGSCVIIRVVDYLVRADLEDGLDHVRAAPRDVGTLELIVRRPAEDEREVLEEGELTPEEGLVGDSWRARSGGDSMPNPDLQLTIMNSRYTALVAGSRDRWALAGDQLYVDFDLSVEHLPPESRLGVGSAVLAVADQPHSGCRKFTMRFGRDALRLANSEIGRQLRLRGLYARVVEAGTIRRGDSITRL